MRDNELCFDMGLNAAKKGFDSMVTVWLTMPPHLREATMAVSIAYTLHKCDGAMHPAIADGNTEFAAKVEQMRAVFNTALIDQIAASKAQNKT